MSSIYLNALKAIPELTAIDAASVKVEILHEELRDSAKVVPQFTDFTERFVAGADVTIADIASDIAKVHAAEAYRAPVGSHLVIIADLLKNRRKNAIIQGVDDALTVIREEVARIHATAGELFARLGSVSSGDEAIDRGVVAEWMELKPLVPAYRDARDAQWKLVAATPDGPDILSDFEYIGHIRGLDILCDEFSKLHPGKLPNVPFPANHRGQPLYDVDYLRWVTGLDADRVWVPTMSELEEERNAQVERINARYVLKNGILLEAERERLERIVNGEPA